MGEKSNCGIIVQWCYYSVAQGNELSNYEKI